MNEETAAKTEKLYALAEKSAQTPKPKHTLFSWKCPKCGEKLAKESLVEMIKTTAPGTALVGETGSEFEKKVLRDAGLELGVYNLKIKHFSCKCGYDYTTASVEPLAD